MNRGSRWALLFAITGATLALFSTLPQKVSSNSRQILTDTPTTLPRNTYFSPGDRHKVLVSDQTLVQTLRGEGHRFVAEYGGQALFEMSTDTANRLSQSQAAEVVDENNLILLNSGSIDTSTREAQRLRSTAVGSTGKQMRLIQFAGPIQPEWFQSLVATGVRVVTYIPNNTYLVYGDSQTLASVNDLAARNPAVQWTGDYVASFRLDPEISARPRPSRKNKPTPTNLSRSGNPQFTIQLVNDAAENAVTLALIQQFKLEPIIKQENVLGYVNVKVALPQDIVINQIASRVDVVSIQPWITPIKFDERQDIIMTGNLSGNVPTPMNYLTYLDVRGFNINTATSFAVNVSDSGVDNATTTPNHFALYTSGDSSNPANSRIIYNRLIGAPNPGSTLQGCDGHGNINAHIIGGFVPDNLLGVFPHSDANNFRWGLGIAPFVKIGSSVIFDPDTFTDPTYQNIESQAYRDGARISSNSWGASVNTYTTDAQQYDALVRDAQPDTGCVLPDCISTPGNQEYVIVFAAGNDGSGLNTVGTPGTGKNVLTVGAAENVNPFGGPDFCFVNDNGADSANDIIPFSSRGPTFDSRKKPDVMAPGTHVSGGVAQASVVLPTGSGTGSQLPCFDGSGVCGGVGENFFPSGQEYYTASSGTSHSTPAVAGVAALIRQHFINQALSPPSPAMTKALISSSARYMSGAGANDTLPSNNQGMGEINLNSYFDTFSTPHIFHDQVPADKFTGSGQQRIINGTISNNTKPFRVTLAWTDVPGPTSGSAFVNNLDLQVTVGGITYKGNVFNGGTSAAGGTADTRNNVENVIVPAGVTGSFSIRVIATNIAGDGVPHDADPLDQDYALVVYNGVQSTVPVLASGSTAITAESCSGPNNAIDPQETVTINFNLSNIGSANTTNLVASLLATGGVTNPSGPQNYGTIVAGGAAVARPFTFTAGTTCGQVLAATLHLQDGATNLGTVSFTFNTGAVAAPSTNTYSSGNISTIIPDEGIVNIPVVISDTGIVSDINVKVRLNHTFVSDVTLTLISPTGLTVPLSVNRGGNGQNYGSGPTDCSATLTVFDDSASVSISAGVAPFAGSFRPESPLSVFNGSLLNGTWTLHVEDNFPQDNGTVFCVQLEISKQPFVCCGSPTIASAAQPTITFEGYNPPNGAPDPMEPITAQFPLINTGTANTANLVATLQNSGGIVPIGSASQNYGVVLAGGPSVTRSFNFVGQGACGSLVTATLHLQDGPQDLGNLMYTFQLGTLVPSSQTFSNTNLIVIPATGTGDPAGAPATPYPSDIVVSGAPTTIDKVTVTINDFNHTFPDDVDVLLVSPTGRKMIVFSDVGGGTDAVNANITLDDAAASLLPDNGPLTSGTFKPGNFLASDQFPAPAPTAPYLSPAPVGSDTLTSAFTGATGGNPNGTWSLYVVDDSNVDSGSFNGGWSLTLTKNVPNCVGPTAASASISGSIADDSGHPVEGVVMTLSGAASALAVTDGSGNYHFDNLATDNFYTITPSLPNYRFLPENRSFSLLGSRSDAVFTGSLDTAVLQNAIDSSGYFVRQQYLDFLGREPDQGGFQYWANELVECSGNASCLRSRRIDVSAAFFGEPEFQETGSFIVRLYRSVLGRQITYGEFVIDRQHIVTGPNLDASKAAFVNAFVQRSEFLQRYQNNNAAESFVDAVLRSVTDSTSVNLSSERDNLILSYNAGNSTGESRALVLRSLSNNSALAQALYNPSFILMEYFGYLKRDPDPGGYNFWLHVLNTQQQGNYRSMVCAFITSAEYQLRFSPVVTRTNAECRP